jgi:hypothetical protein
MKTKKHNANRLIQTKKSAPKVPAGPPRVVGALAEQTRLNATLLQGAIPVEGLKDRTIVVAGDGGTSCAGAYGCAIGGLSSKAVVQREGLAYVLSGTAKSELPSGIAINCSGKTPFPEEIYSATAADRLAATFRGGKAKMAGAGIAIAINEPDSANLEATAQASRGGLIVLGYFADPMTIKYVPVQVDGTIIKENSPYKLDPKKHEPVEARSH